MVRKCKRQIGIESRSKLIRGHVSDVHGDIDKRIGYGTKRSEHARIDPAEDAKPVIELAW